MGEITEGLKIIADDVCEGLEAVGNIINSAIVFGSILDAVFGENSNVQTTELQRDIQETEREKEHALDTIDNCRKSIQTSRETITKYRYQQFCPNAIKEIDDGVDGFEKLLNVNLYVEALRSAQKVAETARNYSDAVLASEKAWSDGINIWKLVRDMVNGRFQQLNSGESRLSLPSGETIPFLLNEWVDENEIQEIMQAVAAEEPPQGWTIEQIQTQSQAVIGRWNQLTTEAEEYCIHTYLRGQNSREFIITLRERGWKYKGFQYENDNPKQDMELHFDSVTGDKLKAIFNLNGLLKLNVVVKNNNTDNKIMIANKLVTMLQESGISVNQLDWY